MNTLSPLILSLLAPLLLASTDPPAARTALQEQAAPAEVTLVAQLAIDAHSEFQLVKGREDWSGETLVRKSESTTPLETRVVGYVDGGSIVRWTYGKVRLAPEPGREAANELAELLAGLVDGMHFDVQLDEHGSVVGLADEVGTQARVQEVAKAAKELMLQRTEIVGAPDSPRRAQIEGAIDSAISALRGPALAPTLLREPTFFYLFCGSTLALGKPREGADSLPSPLGGTPVPSKVRYELVELPADGAQARIAYRQEIDQEQLAEVLLAGLSRMAEQNGTAPPKPEDLPRLDVRDEGEVLFDVASGLPVSARWSRTTLSSDRKRVDWWRIEPRPIEPK